MKILLAGGAGYIGSHTAVELLEAGYDVVIADNYSNSSPDMIGRIEKITGKKVTAYEADVADQEAVRRIFSENEIGAVVHFAGYKAVGESVLLPLKYYRNNLDATLTLLEMMGEFGVTRFVFSSSATVYGAAQSPCREDAPTGNCSNPYGWTKFMIEQILKDWAAADPKNSAVLLRYFNPVGAHESGLIGERPVGIPNNLMPYIMQVAAGKLEKLHVFGNDYPTKDGTGIRDYIHVVDLAKGHVYAVDYAMENTGADAVNLGTGNGYSVFDMINSFEKVNGVPVPYVVDPRRPGDVAELYADPAKAYERYHWRAEKTLDDMCRDSWTWQKNVAEEEDRR